jgi:hypothetical protein
MRTWVPCVAVTLFSIAGGVAHAADDKGTLTYKWVDENGVTQYGDRIPPQYAKKESTVLNSQGVEIRRNDAQKSPEQMAEAQRQYEAALRQRQHDNFLLTTYPSVQDIESLRDERVLQISGQRRAAEAYIETLNGRLSLLQTRALTFKPYNDRPNARRMPDDLAEDLVRALNEMRTQRMALTDKDVEESKLRAQFEADINRYKELRAAVRGR